MVDRSKRTFAACFLAAALGAACLYEQDPAFEGSGSSDGSGTDGTSDASSASGSASSSASSSAGSSGATTTGTSTTSNTSDPSTTDATTTNDATATSTTGDGCGPEAIMADGPVLYWRLGESTGSVATDLTANGQDGAYNNVTLGVPGVSSDGDTAVEFAGSVDSFVQLSPVGLFPTDAFTVEFWVRITGNGANYGMFSYASNQSDNDIYIDDAPSLDLMVNDQNLFSDVDVSDGQWHHVAVTWRSSDGRARFFLDGNLELEQTDYRAGVVLDSAGSLILGQDQDSIGGDFDPSQAHQGELDEVIVFAQELDEAQINAHRAAIECG